MTSPRTVEMLVAQVTEAMKARGYAACASNVYLAAWPHEWLGCAWTGAAPDSPYANSSYVAAPTAEEAADRLIDKIMAWPPKWSAADLARTLGIVGAA